ncbi:MAG: glutamine--fructose-6-phosphate transaminase (isomerizing) [Ectothiorhodospiraceae bacterium]|nr:glutamine--fructose-6-phosphate transaminase (isomerizing) [Ectothiorhodospiraceae bacterium]
MCGIVGAVAERNVVPILVEGLRRLEYRGYDSAGVAVIDGGSRIGRVRTPGKVATLAGMLDNGHALTGGTGIAHTRWATHGPPNEANAHPHVAGDEVAVVHNGIIENHAELRERLSAQGYVFESDTDTEVIANLVLHHMRDGNDLRAAVTGAVAELEGAYAIGVLSKHEPQRIVAARLGSPLVIGIGVGERFIASDVAALVPVTQRFLFLEDGDVADVTRDDVTIIDRAGQRANRRLVTSELTADAVERGEYRHYMQKEIFEQPSAIANTLEGRLAEGRVLEAAFGPNAAAIFDRVKAVQIIACGTSYHAGLVARNWFEGLAGIPCNVEVASEFRYRHPVPNPDTLIVVISQSGETADTLAALRNTRELGYGPSLGIVNAPESSIVREADLVLMTRAGPEIGVASTKAFTTQLVALLMLVTVLGRRHKLDAAREARIVEQLRSVPRLVEEVLELDDHINLLSGRFADKHHALFLGRGVQYPVAMEGALKLKEISYIHAEAYPAGELKHGPLALVDADMPVIVVAPNDSLLEKLKSNLEEVRARGGELYVFADRGAGMRPASGIHVMELPEVGEHVTPIVYTIPLQLLAYHVAVLKGTDVDQPRNLAKSVTVE